MALETVDLGSQWDASLLPWVPSSEVISSGGLLLVQISSGEPVVATGAIPSYIAVF